MADDVTENAPEEGQEGTHDPVVAFTEWQDEKIVTVEKSEWFKVAWKKTIENGTELRKYVTPIGLYRVMSTREFEQREKQGKPGFYLLPKDLEVEGIELVAQLPGAPNMETACTVCGWALFERPGQLKGHLRDVLENLVSGKSTVKTVRFRSRHRLCWQFTHDVLNPFIEERDQARSTLRMWGAGREEEVKAIKAIIEVAENQGQAWLDNRKVSPGQQAALLAKITPN